MKDFLKKKKVVQNLEVALKLNIIQSQKVVLLDKLVEIVENLLDMSSCNQLPKKRECVCA